MAGEISLYNISPESERSILSFSQKAHELLINNFSMRENLSEIDRTYMREKDWTKENIRARIANRLGDASKFQDITVPIIMPQVESALGYFMNVFCTGYPIFGVSGDPANEDAALMMETIMGENAITAGWSRQLLMFFRDGLKYNLHGLELDWQQRTTFSIENDSANPGYPKKKQVTWKGNVLKRLDLYNTFFDPRVHPAEICTDGEYAGYIEIMSRIRMKKFCNDLLSQVKPVTIKRAFESAAPATGTVSGAPYSYFIPQINPYPMMNRNNWYAGMDWWSWANPQMAKRDTTIRYNNIFEKQTLYARILPSDFGIDVPQPNTPQVWRFVIINQQVVLVAERMSNAHGLIPMFFGQPLEDGLDFQTKSFAQNVQDMQAVASAMWNGYIASKRRLVGDRVLYDPLRIRKEDINNTNPAAKIPVRPAAYGKPVHEAVYQFPYHDEQTRSLLEGADMVVKFSNLINQQNPAAQGQFVKGNKTKHEYDDIMGHGNTKNQGMAMMCEFQVFTPMKEAMKLNVLQYSEDNKEGTYNSDRGQTVPIDVTMMRKQAVQFKVSDGIMPTDKLMSTEEFQVALQAFGSSPQLAADYNIGPMFTYLMKLRGADLRPFEKSMLQKQYEQALQVWQQTVLEAVKTGADPKTLPPQPEMPPALIQELQQKQKAGGSSPSAEAAALQTTQG